MTANPINRPNIFLMGMMGSGKSTVGPLLAASLDCPFVDLDEAVERAAGKSIEDIFQQSGEARFREYESLALEQVAQPEGTVVACGGGIVTEPANAHTLEKQFCIYLTAKPSTLASRVESTGNRPLLQGAESFEDTIAQLLGNREPLYRRFANIVIETDDQTPEQVNREILNLLVKEFITGS